MIYHKVAILNIVVYKFSMQHDAEDKEKKSDVADDVEKYGIQINIIRNVTFLLFVFCTILHTRFVISNYI